MEKTLKQLQEEHKKLIEFITQKAKNNTEYRTKLHTEVNNPFCDCDELEALEREYKEMMR